MYQAFTHIHMEILIHNLIPILIQMLSHKAILVQPHSYLRRVHTNSSTQPKQPLKKVLSQFHNLNSKNKQNNVIQLQTITKIFNTLNTVRIISIRKVEREECHFVMCRISCMLPCWTIIDRLIELRNSLLICQKAFKMSVT